MQAYGLDNWLFYNRVTIPSPDKMYYGQFFLKDAKKIKENGQQNQNGVNWNECGKAKRTG